MKNTPLTILVLGVGGNVSQGILKALACSSLDCRVVAACTSAAAFGLYCVDSAWVSPRADSPEFLQWLEGVCREESVDAILSGVEPVLDVLALHRERIRQRTGAVCVVGDVQAMATGADKLLTCEWLRGHGLPYPRFAAADDESAVGRLLADCGFPLIAKPRAGKGSQGIFVIGTPQDLNRLGGNRGYVIQELLGDDDSEYTAACFTDSSDALRGTIVFHRYLTSGTTSCAVAGEFPEVRDMSRVIAEKLKAKGPCNMQMRMHRGTPVCFEINVRFSGTTPIRARLGFNDVEAAIRHYVMGEPAVDLPAIVSGQAVRYWNEAYIDPRAHAALAAEGKLRQPGDFRVFIEPYGERP